VPYTPAPRAVKFAANAGLSQSTVNNSVDGGSGGGVDHNGEVQGRTHTIHHYGNHHSGAKVRVKSRVNSFLSRLALGHGSESARRGVPA
jgi:hypothetical protein